MIKKSVIIFISSLITLFAQSVPFNYSLEGETSLEKEGISNPASNSISDIITRGDSVWLGTSRGVSLSPDKGETWINYYGSEAFGTESISAIAFDRYTGNIWAATAHSVNVNNQNLPEGSGLRYSTDKGLTWNIVDQPVDAETDTVIAYGNNNLRAIPVTVRIQNLIYDIAFTPGTIWVASFAGGLRKSTDLGRTWSRVILPPDNRNSVSPDDTLNFCVAPVGGRICPEGHLNYRLFSVIAVNETTLYAGTAGGINKSTDNGLSWVKFNRTNQDNPISGNFVVALDYNPYNNTIWGATWRAEGSTEFYAVSSSEDGGLNWTTHLHGERAHNFGFKNDEVIAPTDNAAFRYTSQRVWLAPSSIVDTRSNQRLTTSIFYSAATQAGGYIWLGSNDGLIRLREAIASNVWTGDWRIYFAAPPLNSKEESFAYPVPFSPRNNTLKFKYSTGGVSEKVSIRIFDFGMNLVRTVIQNIDRVKTNDDAPDRWDGRDENGNIVPNGVYFYRIDIGSAEPLFGKIIVLQ
jgi:ligand-binding sensor domain-containing protein